MEKLTREDFLEIAGWFDFYMNHAMEGLDKEDAEALRSQAIRTAQKLHDIKLKQEGILK